MTDIFAMYIASRQEAKEAETKVANLKPLVVAAAMEVLGTGIANDQTFYSSALGKLSLRFKKTIPKDNQDLQYLQEMIQLELEEAARINAVAIAKTEDKIKDLTAWLELLRNTDNGRKLEIEKKELENQIAYQEPIVAFLFQSLKGIS